MTFDQILTFVTIYRLGSISKAAEKLFLPQPTVSHRIKQLERELGKPLLIRANGTVRLSQEGHAFLPYALSALSALDQGREAVEQVNQGLKGTLSLGCNNSFAGTILPSILESFMAAHPGIALKVHCYSTEEQIKMLKTKQIQIGITRYTANDPGITFELLYAHPAYAVLSREHPYAARDALSLQDILKEKLILYEADSLYRQKIDLTFKDLNMLYDPHYETNNLQLIKCWIKSTMGIFLSCPLYMQPEIESGDMVAIPIESNPFPLNQIFLVYREEHLNSLDRLFMRHVEQQMEINEPVGSDNSGDGESFTDTCTS
ncbi:HTH-type transcriptional regulator HdfR [Paenibacillus solanacearum]|uniref:HTH-type transcriptional regulator HdfR n=1 Tax=Paenibacillus solanacearum TaxID=2048548 RepID=A0A916JWU5_9BACL|nr:LysR family transcriptional regulator [Paenibacillus solanacearum]CAG7608102.1 HTH-type transcriptional regulator HdfR [Paenibacillus solanacearum]